LVCCITAKPPVVVGWFYSRVGGAHLRDGGAVDDVARRGVHFLVELLERVSDLSGADDLHLGVSDSS
jgi:hypothetical protein